VIAIHVWRNIHNHIRSGSAALAARQRAKCRAAISSIVIDGGSAPNSTRAFGRAVDDFFACNQWGNCGTCSKALLQSYRSALEPCSLASLNVKVQEND
jgi:hypothetical protein